MRVISPMKIFLSLLLSLLVVVLSDSTVGAAIPDFRFRQITEDQGLPGNSVRCIFQDHLGILWFGIESIGLCKYDGYNYTVFANHPGDSTSIGNNFIDAICEDNQQNLLIGTNRGIYKFNRTTEKFKSYLASYKPKKNIMVTSLLVDPKNNIWAGTNSGLYLYNSSTDTYDLFPLNGTKDSSVVYVTAVVYDRKANLLISSLNGVFIYHLASKQVSKLKSSSNQPLIANSIQADGNSNLWICTTTALLFYNNTTHEYTDVLKRLGVKVSGFFHDRIFYDQMDRIWLGGVSLTIIDTKTLQELPMRPEVLNSFINCDVRGFFEDRSGLIWIGTKSQGVFSYNKKINYVECQPLV